MGGGHKRTARGVWSAELDIGRGGHARRAGGSGGVVFEFVRVEFELGSKQYRRRFLGQLNVPPARDRVQHTERSTGTEPAVGNLLEMLDPVHNVAGGVLIRQVKQMDRACGMSNVHGNVADLAESIRFLVDAKVFGDIDGRMGTISTRGYMCRQRRLVLVIFQKWTE